MIRSSLLLAVCSLLAFYWVQSAPVSEFEPLSDEMIDYINNKVQTTWTAGRNPQFATMQQAQQLLGAIITDRDDHKLPVKEVDHDDINREYPTHFDCRDKWPKCKSIGLVRDQSACGSCWAIAAVEAMTDRICIYSNATKHTMLSTRDLMSCCNECGRGCQGGYPPEAWLYWVNEGIVSGGLYNSSSGCQPYPFPPCSHHTNGTYPPCPDLLYHTPKCSHKCESGSHLNYTQDRHFGKDAYRTSMTEHAIMSELMDRGPLEVSFKVYTDFLSYKKGIYQHVTGFEMGGHAVKMIGWGEEKGVPYWLLVNSWNPDWGENGYFRILRGEDECEIEEHCFGGIPKL